MAKTLSVLMLALAILAGGCAGDRAARKKAADAKASLGTSLVQEGRLEAGLQELQEALKLDPDNPEFHNAIALGYRDLGKYPEAIHHLQKALELKPGFPDAENNLGTVYLMQGRVDTAIPLFEKAAANVLYRTPYISYRNLGFAYHQKGEYEKAIHYYNRAIERFPGFTPVYDDMGLTYEKMGKTDEAIASYKRCIELAPKVAVPRLHLGSLYLKLGLHKQAAAELKETIRLDPKGPYGKEAQRLLEQVTIGGGPEKEGNPR
jgi:type IV pilus biogenesis/stability protein PilW